MKVKQILIAASFILATAAQAQVKVGSNPTTISSNAVLDVEGTSGSHTVVLQNGNTGVGTVTPGNKVEINQGIAGNSGLRFSQINSTTVPTTTKAATLGVDNNGDVVVVDGAVTRQYLSVARVNSYQGVSGGQDIVFNSITSENGTIPYNTSTGVATLTIGKTYVITAALHLAQYSAGSFAWIRYGFVNAETNNLLIPTGTAETQAAGATTGSGSSGGISVIYKAVAGANTIKLRALDIFNYELNTAGQANIRHDRYSGFVVYEL
ncbi:hypothetical protein DSL64_26730 [Dyadobacter luteus]|uniref:C1q domain-containing protein n=1 Tax=Dyadobacter luteus TaxID=2259619 RepID=A0A3D8Y6J8_9BACT|nr:hypothetical protein [Dyadobacter luteus]REA56516.1 hypothetical protein DSL64_26730 [Dyadobacter luteus]